jgi:hypothetical protein
MRITRPLLAALAMTALSPIIDTAPADAQAATCRPWCVYYGGGGRGGGTNCGFISYEQCMWTAQGSDVCMPNGFCPPHPGARGGPPGSDDGWSRRR